MSRLEAAIRLLKRQGPEAWRIYAMGAVPVVLTCLIFIRDMSSGFGEGRLVPETLVCSAAFLWGAFCKSRFAGTLMDSLSEGRVESARSSWPECVAVQWPMQGLKLIVLPFAAICIVPLPWVSGFFRAADYETSLSGVTLRSAMRNAARRASTQSKQHWAACLILAAGALAAFVNFSILLLALPPLLRAMTGLESEWTRNPGAPVQMATIAGGLTWLFIDPVMEAYSAVRCFESEARTDGRDLFPALRRLAMTAGMAMLLLSGAPQRARAEAQPQAVITSAQLNGNIESILKSDPEYGWSRPEHRMPDDSIAGRIYDALGSAARRMGKAIHDFFDWLGKLFAPADPTPSSDKGKGKSGEVWWLLIALAATVAGGIAVAVMRTLRRERKPAAIAEVGSGQVPEDNDAALSLAKPDSEWLAMARQYAADGDLRLAARALYLANLSFLGSRELIALARAKTNGMYERELKARDRTGGLLRPFANANRGYERAWFGMHDVTPELFASLKSEAEALRGNA